MPAYVIVDIEVTDTAAYEPYKRLAQETVHAYGGKYIAPGGHAEALEGDWPPHRMVILEFDSVERAKAGLSSPEYAGPREMRHAAARSRMIVVEGVPPG